MRHGILRIIGIVVWVVGSAGMVWAAPDWVEKGTSKKFPPEKYFIGVASSAEPDGAKDKARAEIAKILKARIQQEQTEKETYAQQTVGKKTTSSQTFEAASATKVSVDESLEGVTIAETYDQKGTHYALAVLDREKTAADLRKKVTDLELQGDELLKQANTENKLMRAKAMYSAWQKFDTGDGFARQLAVVSPTGTGVTLRAGETRIKRDQALADVKFRMGVTGEGVTDIIKALTEALNGVGFQGVTGEAKEDLTLTGEVVMEPFDRGSQYQFAKYSIRVDLIDAASGESVGTFTKVGDEGSTTFDLAKQKAIVKVRSAVKKEMQKLLTVNLLGGTVELE